MAWSSYELNTALYQGITGQGGAKSDLVERAARSLVQDVCRARVAEHFSAQGGETAFWDAVSAIGELAPALDALMAYAYGHLDYGMLASVTGNRDDARSLQFYDPNGEPRPTGLLAGAAKGFAEAVAGALLRSDPATSVGLSAQSVQDDETFTSTKMAGFTAMT